MNSGLPFYVKHAKSLGATRDEIISVILIGLPAVGNAVIQALPIAIDAYDKLDWWTIVIYCEPKVFHNRKDTSKVLNLNDVLKSTLNYT